MSFELIVTTDADRDIEVARLWYDEQQEGIGLKFIIAVRLRFGDILKIPLVPRAFGRKQIRKVTIPHSPYIIYYRVVDRQIRILGVIHGARDPKYVSFRTR